MNNKIHNRKFSENSAVPVDKAMNSIREMMQYSPSTNENEDILELTEDDLVDEYDQDAFVQQRNNIRKNTEINDLLTQINHPFNNKEKTLEEAIESVAYIKSLIKRIELNNSPKGLDNEKIEEIFLKMIEPSLNKWLEENLIPIIQKLIKDELRAQYFKQNDKGT